MKSRKELIFNISALLIYAVLTFVVVLHHEIWADEAQAWLLAKHLSFPGLFKHLVNEGHPSFFYLLIMPFAKLNFSIFSMQIICWLSSCAAVFLLLQFSPFSKFAKFAIITSAGFLYFFPVIARSYSILPVLVFLAAILYSKQRERPFLYAVILAIIANTHVIMFGFVFILSCYFLYDNIIKNNIKNKKYITAYFIIIASLIGVILQLSGTFESNSAITFDMSNLIKNIFNTFSIFYLNSVDLVLNSMFEMPVINTFSITASIFLFIIFVLLHIQLWKINRRLFILSSLSILFQFFIYITSYKNMLYQTRIFSAYTIIIFSYWICLKSSYFKNKTSINSKKFINGLLGIFFMTTFFCGIKAALLDFKSNYSSAKETAEYIQNYLPKDSVIIPNLDAFGLAVYEYSSGQKFFSIHQNKEIKYMHWYNPVLYPDDVFSQILENKIKENNFKKVFILVSSILDFQHLENTMPGKYKLIFVSSNSLAAGEAFRIYQYIGKN